MSETSPQASGRDLARQALAAYKAGRTPGQAPAKKKPRRVREDRTGGRDPLGLGSVLGQLNAEQGWGAALDGGSILDRWGNICPERYVGNLEPVAFDAEHGRLDIRPGSHTYATELRMFGPMLAKELNTKLGRDVVRTIRILPVGSITPAAAEAEEVSRRDNPAPAPARTRDAASPGYQRTLAVALEHKPEPGAHLNSRVRDAIEASTRALADPARREPEHAFTDAVAEHERLEAQAGPSAGSIEASIAAAIAAKHLGTREPRRLFEAS